MKRFLIFLWLSFLVVLKITASDNIEIYKSVNVSDMKIALSFDDGPHPKQTEDILTILEKYNVKATFFVVGKNVELSPDVLRRIAEEGHEIGNHTYTHTIVRKKDSEIIKNELEKTHEVILSLCDYDVKLFRPPGGNVSTVITDAAKVLNYKIVLWNIDTRDWAHRSVRDIVKNIEKNAKSGSIILFHDYIARNTPTPEALELIIPILKEKGYSFVTVGELIESEDIR